MHIFEFTPQKLMRQFRQSQNRLVKPKKGMPLHRKGMVNNMYIAIIVILVALSAVFSSTETAFASVNRIRIKSYANDGNKKAKKALNIIDNFDKALTAILIGNNVVNILSASLATVMFTKYFGAGSVGMATLVMTVVVLIFGEIIPKSLASENAEKMSLFMAPVLSAIMTILKPVIFLMSKLKNGVTKLFGTNKEEPLVTEEELKYIIDEIEDEGVLEEQESDLVRSALDFDEITINEILIPRVNVAAIDIESDFEQIKDAFLNEQYSRFPIYKDSIDNIIGILHQSDFFGVYFNHATDENRDIKSILKKPIYIPEHQKISVTLNLMQKQKVHMAIVIDEYGGTKGIVTLEDIIEELVGEIYDESDEEDTSFIQLSSNSYEVSADLSINDFLDRLELPEDTINSDCNSVGGWFMDVLNKVPEYGNTIQIGSFTLKAISVNDQKLERMFVTINPQTPETENKEVN